MSGLQVVKSPFALKDGKYLLDVVAVHGLGGHREASWTYHNVETGEKTFWLRDLLPERLPYARVMTFGYNGSVSKSTSYAGSRDNARKLLTWVMDMREEDEEKTRPLVFIGHGFGGIIIKQALCFARNEEIFKPIRGSTFGLMFFATPHRGTDVQSWQTLTTNIADATPTTHRETRMEQDTKRNSEYLMNVSEDFRSMAKEFALASFYEEDITECINAVVVARESAVMEIAGEDVYQLPGNHMNMCKFSREDNEHFDVVWRRVRRLAEGSPKAEKLAKEERACLQSMCDVKFHEYRREHVPPKTPDTCSWLLKRRQFNEWVQGRQSGLLWLMGSPGCGKTVIASYVVDTLMNPQVLVANAFCTDKDPHRDNTTGILKALVHQILRGDRVGGDQWLIRKHALPIFRTRSPEEATWSLEKLAGLLQQVIPDVGRPVYFVVDGLDHVDGQSQGKFRDAVKPLLEIENAIVKVFVTSTPTIRLLDLLEHYPQIQIKSETVIEDIRATVAVEVRKLASRRHLTENQEAQLCEQIVRKSCGMFHWAIALVKNLRQTSTDMSTPKLDPMLILGGKPIPYAAAKGNPSYPRFDVGDMSEIDFGEDENVFAKSEVGDNSESGGDMTSEDESEVSSRITTSNLGGVKKPKRAKHLDITRRPGRLFDGELPFWGPTLTPTPTPPAPEPLAISNPPPRIDILLPITRLPGPQIQPPTRYSVAAVAWPEFNYRAYFQPNPEAAEAPICEAKQFEGKWTVGNSLFAAKGGTPLAAISRHYGQDIRIFYLTPENTLSERRFTPTRGWRPGPLNTYAIQPAPYTRLAAVAWSSGIRIYYQDATTDAINEYLCLEDGETWVPGTVPPIAALRGTSIAAAGWTGERGFKVRVWFQDGGGRVGERCWDGGWGVGTFTPVLAPKHSAITAVGWYHNAAHLRVYWRNEQGRLVEYSRIEEAGDLPFEEGEDNPRVLEQPESVGEDEGFAMVQWNGGLQRRMYIKGKEEVVGEECWAGGRWRKRTKIQRGA